jgi:hypothetical protein
MMKRDGITKLGRNGGGSGCIEGWDGIACEGDGLTVNGGGSGG